MNKVTANYLVWYKKSCQIFNPHKIKIIFAGYLLPYAIFYFLFSRVLSPRYSFLLSNLAFVIWSAIYYINRKHFKLKHLAKYTLKNNQFTAKTVLNLTLISMAYSLAFYTLTLIYSINPAPDVEKNILYYLIYLSPFTFIISLFAYKICLSLFCFSFLDITNNNSTFLKSTANSFALIQRNFRCILKLIAVTYKWPLLISASIYLLVTLSIVTADQSTSMNVFTSPINSFDPFNTLGSVFFMEQISGHMDQIEHLKSTALIILVLGLFSVFFTFLNFFLLQFAFCKFIIAHHFAFKDLKRENYPEPIIKVINKAPSTLATQLLLAVPIVPLQIKAIKRAQHSKFTNKLISLTYSSNDRVRDEAINALLNNNDIRIKKHLLTMLDTSNKSTRLAVLKSLAKFKEDSDVHKKLSMMAFAEKDDDIKEAAKLAINS